MGSVTASTMAQPTLRVAAFCGSLRKDSWHRGLIRAAEELCEESIPGLRIDHIGVFLDLHFINKPELHIRAFADPPKFDEEGNLIDAVTRERLKKVLLSLQAFALRLKHKDE
ncbi:unnamed protein product [Triticum turgidum subsp. durum]|uniref:NADPH-dependent FMN reductase-like domain-containing protein n=1 Tax=Triticum turgidum subsp. durum TaxID=4567 RepID=A0A9R1QAV3_TRITD|nr:unnamed protein product [Triticum turgidum subsp. durum]